MDKKHLLEHIAKAADLSTEPMPGKPLIEVVGDSSVLIENHCGVISYSMECVTIKTKQGCIIVRGAQLVLRRMSKDQLKISGTINDIELRGRS